MAKVHKNQVDAICWKMEDAIRALHTTRQFGCYRFSNFISARTLSIGFSSRRAFCRLQGSIQTTYFEFADASAEETACCGNGLWHCVCACHLGMFLVSHSIVVRSNWIKLSTDRLEKCISGHITHSACMLMRECMFFFSSAQTIEDDIKLYHFYLSERSIFSFKHNRIASYQTITIKIKEKKNTSVCSPCMCLLVQ